MSSKSLISCMYCAFSILVHPFLQMNQLLTSES
nr:MAG TPA: hypothetical protein [Caudoviricetes sp.]